MEEVKKIKTHCRNCHGACGVIAQVKDGRVVKVEGDPDSPISRGTMCTKGLAVTQLAHQGTGRHAAGLSSGPNYPSDEKSQRKMGTDHLG